MAHDDCAVKLDEFNLALKDPLKIEEPDSWDTANEEVLQGNVCIIDTEFDGSEIKEEITSDEADHTRKVESDAGECAGSNEKSYRKDLLATLANELKNPPWKCTSCEVTFKSERALKIHRNKHENSAIHICQYCPKTFEKKMHLTSHLRTHKKFECGNCCKSFPNKQSLAKHEKVGNCQGVTKFKTKILYTCTICRRNYSDLRGHRETHLQEITNEYSCFNPDENSCSVCIDVMEILPHIVTEAKHQDSSDKTAGVEQNYYENFDKFFAKLKAHENSENEECGLYAKILETSLWYACDVCDKRCPKEKDLINHKLTHDTQKRKLADEENVLETKRCNVCETDFESVENLASHRFTHDKCKTFEDVNRSDSEIKNDVQSDDSERSNEKPNIDEVKRVKCKVCNKSYHHKYINSHMRIHTKEKPYRCDTCGEYMITQARLYTHKLKHTEERKHVCNICNKAYKVRFMLKRHVLVHHTDDPLYSCETCGKKYATQSLLRLHQQSHSDKREFACELCDKAFKVQRNLKGHIRQVHISKRDPSKKKKVSTYYFKKTACKICLKMFHVKYIDIHMKVHSEQKPFHCDICNRGVNSEKQLRNHKLTHSEDRQYVCNFCGKSYKTKYVLYLHTMFNHSTERPYPCEVCGKGFPTIGTRNTHQKIHTDSKDFICDICNKAFAIKKMLSNHMKIHFVETKKVSKPKTSDGGEPFTCNVCGKKYALYGSLMYHKKSVHETMNHKCQFCGKAFVYPIGLERHLRVHTGEKSHLCDECGDAFHSYTSFIQHKKMTNCRKTKSKRLECDVCGKAFANSKFLLNHYTRKHKISDFDNVPKTTATQPASKDDKETHRELGCQDKEQGEENVRNQRQSGGFNEKRNKNQRLNRSQFNYKDIIKFEKPESYSDEMKSEGEIDVDMSGSE